ncbi:hypothetical protein F0P93_17515 [Larkinella humicola]|uniref:Uncharacterized protein n=1 Tax=Larkinella humicola TaxID=2607654 RepID=A0A5N1JG29_9BACT|nr:hypothetical protein F0P93_17515 [Larkinella humicola]
MIFSDKLCVIAFLLLTASRPVHPVHTSITQMQYNAAEKTFEVSLRVFTDDLEEALTKENNNQRVRLSDKDANGPLVERYVRKHFGLTSASRQRKPYRYVGKEQEVDATWIYIEIPYNEPVQGSLLQQSMLTDLFDDQMNLVNVSYLAEKKTVLFRKSNTQQVLTW